MVGMLGIPLRTLQRRLKLLVDAGLVKVRRWITDWGYRHMNIYTIPSLVRSVDPLGQSQDQSGASKVVQDSVSDKNILTDVQGPHEPHIWHESDRWLMARPKRSATEGQLAFDFGQTSTDQLDGCTSRCDTGNRQVSRGEGRGTPASRSVSYWLSGRISRPPAGVIAGVAKAIKRCFEFSIVQNDHELSESAMRDVIDSLMMRGLDAFPAQYYPACGVLPPRRPRPRTSGPLYKKHHKRSTMTLERMAASSQRYRSTGNGSPTVCTEESSAPKRPAPKPASKTSSTPYLTPGDLALFDRKLPWWYDLLDQDPRSSIWSEPPANGQLGYAAVTPPPEAGMSSRVRIDLPIPAGKSIDSIVDDILASLEVTP